jgi:hypothetical protein
MSCQDKTREQLPFTLETAPEDDEPESAEEKAAVAIAWREHAEGKSLSTEELMQSFGFSGGETGVQKG